MVRECVRNETALQRSRQNFSLLMRTRDLIAHLTRSASWEVTDGIGQPQTTGAVNSPDTSSSSPSRAGQNSRVLPKRICSTDSHIHSRQVLKEQNPSIGQRLKPHLFSARLRRELEVQIFHNRFQAIEHLFHRFSGNTIFFLLANVREVNNIVIKPLERLFLMRNIGLLARIRCCFQAMLFFF